MLAVVLGLVVGFAGGYGIRELQSRRRRAAAREEYFIRQQQRQQQKLYDNASENSVY